MKGAASTAPCKPARVAKGLLLGCASSSSSSSSSAASSPSCRRLSAALLLAAFLPIQYHTPCVSCISVCNTHDFTNGQAPFLCRVNILKMPKLTDNACETGLLWSGPVQNRQDITSQPYCCHFTAKPYLTSGSILGLTQSANKCQIHDMSVS